MSTAKSAVTRQSAAVQRPSTAARPCLRTRTIARSHIVTLEHGGKTHKLSVPDGTTILEVALDNGIDLPHDCKLGVCMTCPAKLVSGSDAATAYMVRLARQLLHGCCN